MADGGARGENAPMRASVRNPGRRRCEGRRRGRQEGLPCDEAKAKARAINETSGAQAKLMHRVRGRWWEVGGSR